MVRYAFCNNTPYNKKLDFKKPGLLIICFYRYKILS